MCGKGQTFPDYTYGTHAAEVAVDLETGVVQVLAYVGCHDVGRAINPLRVEGQIQGGVAQGLGYALSEEIVTDNGTSQSVLFADYLMPTSQEVPDIRPNQRRHLRDANPSSCARALERIP